VSDAPAVEPRTPLSGSQAQIVDDLDRLRALGVNEVFFDMNRFPITIDQQFRLLDRLRTAAKA
jgi:hypothetical protein